MSFRALAVDLDGTLLAPDGNLTARTRTAVERAASSGWHVVLATARSFQQAERVAEALGVIDVVIACAGAEVRRRRDGVCLYDVRLPAPFATALYELCEEGEGMVFVYQECDILVRATGMTPPPERDEFRHIETFAGADPTPRGVLVFGEALQALVADVLRPAWGDHVRFLDSLTGGGERVMTITGLGADKGLAIEVACEDLGISPAQIVVMGDAETDLEMFRVAGASVAMGQAAAAVRAAATWVTASNADDGVAVAIERLLRKEWGPVGRH